ncbi:MULTISPECIES: VCBS domain-containing protein [unclassified Pseudoalteromonas]|uniref:VCBS domain-containing protein n=1 Tax=unclassified Pseudoalteromonas TaxID=194690 RepID=UPI0025B405FC|nr:MULTISPECIES: VCBS domain-containing protein [unclassified Pseudoalteromonas]MDN3378047.1 VCBS domain-containing protein [Pseudoalteromonas sp. APC 3893]MDN3386812.1 VCBS domain-containing protein [Pseudoalteromonas sp. APC 4017]
MNNYKSKLQTASVTLLIASTLMACGSSGSSTQTNAEAEVSAQAPATITGDLSSSITALLTVSVSGKLNVTDEQSDEAAFVEQANFSTEYGAFTLSSIGNWSYNLNINDSRIVQLLEGDTLQDSILVSSLDGTTATVLITINGSKQLSATGFVMSSEVTLNSDGANTGLDAYTLIENVFSQGAIEAPDMYEGNHQGVLHIIEDTDDVIGNHFVFLAHRDTDQDKDKGLSDRQRNEIKAYDKSPQETLAYKGDTFQYSWKFKVSSELELTSKFSHFFQLKARNDNNDNSNGNDDQPIITLSGAQKNSTGNQLQVRYSAGFDENGNSTGLDKNLIETDWSLITDEWVHVFVQATFSEDGKFDMTLTRLSDNEEIFNISEQHIDMWRGVLAQDFARPKWGIYRSIVETDSLRAEEEQVRFADFSIKKGTLAQ